MKIYTKTGDEGETSLLAGGRVRKNNIRVEAYGTVDELNSCLGLARSFDLPAQADAWLEIVQNDLFTLGADLATPQDAKADWLVRVKVEQVTPLESWIDAMDADLPPLKNFILPGGTSGAGALHLARTICRRAERIAVQLGEEDTINTLVIMYLNRLSDFLFTLARWVNFQAGESETKWSVRPK
jgi:cob(I)alamin adenosyltransferase